MKRLLALAVVLLAFVGQTAFAARSSDIEEYIASFHSDIQLDSSNHPRITETIDYNFPYSTPNGRAKHGIFRYIPRVYNSGTNKTYYTSFKLNSVTDEKGTSYKYSQSQNKDHIVIKIGDPDQVIAGRHIYKISYELYPLITEGDKADLFNFDVTGLGWEVPIERASARLVVAGATPLAAVCYTGPQNSVQQYCRSTKTDTGYDFETTTENYDYLSLTIGADLPKGFVTNYLQLNTRRPEDLWALVPAGLGILLILIASTYYFITLWQDRRRKNDQTVIAQYEPPNGLSPAEIGTLADDTSNMVEVTATLIDLAVRGYIKIEQTTKKTWYRGAQYKFIKLKDYLDLPHGEIDLLTSIFSAKDEIALKDVDKKVVSAQIKKFKEGLGKDLDTKDYYSGSPHKSLKNSGVLGVVGVVYGIIQILYLPAILLIDGDWKGSFAFVFVAAVIFWYAWRRARLTPKGFEQWAEVKGFQLFLSVTEKDRLAFTDAPAKTPELFSKLLPYAVALGVEKQWAKQFEGMDMAQSTGWYYSPYYGGGWSSTALAGDLSSGFSSSVNSGFAAPSSSGSGGGFSGGGFGGGGGGSW